MSLRYVLLINKHSQTRLSRYYKGYEKAERLVASEILRPCLQRGATPCGIFKYKDHKVVYRRYASLYFVFGNKMSLKECNLLQELKKIESLDKLFQGVFSELDVMFKLDKVHILLDEIITNGEIIETNQAKLLRPLLKLEAASKTVK